MRYHVNGELVPADEATVSVRDRGFMYGDAAFETLRAYGGEVFEWAAHADRLRASCDLLALDHGLSGADLRERVRETLAANDLADAYVRLSITRGVQPGKLTPGPATDPTVVVIVDELPRGGVGGEPVWNGPATVALVDTERAPDAAIPARAKTHNYLNGVLAKLDARDGDSMGADDADGADAADDDAPGADAALMLDAAGDLAECATSNVCFVDDGTLHTPSLDGPVLPGVTRRVVLDLAEQAGVPVETGGYAPDVLRSADEAFLTNTTWELRPVERVDGTPVSGDAGGGGATGDDSGSVGDAGGSAVGAASDGAAGPVTRRLAAAFDELVERRHY